MNKGKKSKWGTIILIGFFLYFVYIFIDQQKILYAKNLEISKIQARIDEEEKLNQLLKEQKEILNTDEYVESIARKKLGMVKQGEKVFVDVNK